MKLKSNNKYRFISRVVIGNFFINVMIIVIIYFLINFCVYFLSVCLIMWFFCLVVRKLIVYVIFNN